MVAPILTMTQTKTMASGSVTRLTQIPTVSKDIPKVKVFESRSKSKVIWSKVLEPNERTGREESICEISKPYPPGSKDNSQG